MLVTEIYINVDTQKGFAWRNNK